MKKIGGGGGEQTESEIRVVAIFLKVAACLIAAWLQIPAWDNA